MAITYKDINLLSQKSSVAGTEKLPVSDTQYITTAQISTKVASDLSSSNIAYIGATEGSATYVDGGTVIDVTTKEDKSNKVTSLSALSTDTQYPSAKCVYDLLGDVESLILAL